MLSQVIRDIRYAIRALVRTPAFTAVAALTLALGIGANTAIFSVVNGVLLRPMPFEDPDQLVAVRSDAPGLGYDNFPLSPGIYFQYSDAQIFEELALLNRTAVNVTGDGNPERIDASFTSRTLFPTLGVSPLLGRNFTEEEDLPEGPQVVVISHAVWQARYSGSRDVLGRTLQVDGVTRDIVGVMPRELRVPLRGHAALDAPGDRSRHRVSRLVLVPVHWTPEEGSGTGPGTGPNGPGRAEVTRRLRCTGEQGRDQLRPVPRRGEVRSTASLLQRAGRGRSPASALDSARHCRVRTI